MFKEFREFTMKGNVLDMAVGIIMGLAFGKIVTSLVGDILIVAFVVFLIVSQFEKLKKKGEAAPATKECPYCFSAIALMATRCPQCTSELT